MKNIQKYGFDWRATDIVYSMFLLLQKEDVQEQIKTWKTKSLLLLLNLKSNQTINSWFLMKNTPVSINKLYLPSYFKVKYSFQSTS